MAYTVIGADKVKRKSYIIILSTTLVLCFIIMIFSALNQSTIITNTTESKKSSIIVLDSGHGGEDPGAVGVNSVYECDVNLSITLKLNDILHLNGYKTVLTRKDKDDIADKSLDTIAKRKKSDMYKRLDIYNSDLRNVAISIHQNIFPAESCSGTQVFYSKQNPLSKTLADNITNSVVSNLQNDNERISKEANGIFLLDNAKVPAIIVECGFLSNQNDTYLLCDKEYQKKFSYCLFQGLMNSNL